MIKYEMVEHEKAFHDKHWSVRLLEGEYEGVVYQYDTVKFEEQGENIVLAFNTLTVENPDNKDLTNDDFKDTIGEILTELIEEYLQNAGEENAQNGTGDTETSSE